MTTEPNTNPTPETPAPAEAAELSSALFSSGSAAALELAPVFADHMAA